MIPKRDDILSGMDVHSGSFGGGHYHPISDIVSLHDTLKKYTTEEILDNIDIEEIQLYLRKKKLNKITKKI